MGERVQGKTNRSRRRRRCDAKKKQVTFWDTFVSGCGHGMMILCLLDFVRLHLGVPLVVGDPSAGKSDSMASWVMDYSSSWFGGSSSP